ncbi:hypothetical protein [Rhodanobacter hydrolyticus]|uniref:DUF805 domain-containing protein n=1 Tax=Rhodanobacter hydrolyticus TaxID=2250595 RepID=A0ABW8J4V0_9GAMM
MTGQAQDFFHHYRALDTRVLLARYRSDGLLPEARAALLEVLADRGYTVEALENSGADGIVTLRIEESIEAHSAPGKAGRSLASTWRWFQRKVAVFALLASERGRLRETWAQVARLCLLATCLWSVGLASLFGMGLFAVANVFCDSGPAEKCFRMGLHFLEVGALADVLLIPAMLALLFPEKWIAWYLKAVPVLALAVFVAAIHWYRILPAFCAKAAELSAVITLLAIAYLILSWKSAPAPAPEPA